ncbi:hypothetical protein Tco_0634012 [Tanacetum coccineum]
MTRNLKLLRNFVEKFMGIICYGNHRFATIIGYGDYVHKNVTICHVYYVEGLGHNLFSVGKFCDGDLEVAFHSKTCYIQNLEGDDLLTGSRESNLYTISISDIASSPVFLMSKASLTKSLNDLGKLKPKADIGIFIGYFEYSRAESTNTPSKEDLDGLFGPIYDEYFKGRPKQVSTNSVVPDTSNTSDTSSSTTIIVDTDEAPHIVSTYEEQTSP